MMEGIYYMGEQLRWNLGFPQPNAGGAFAAMLTATLWCLVLLPGWRKAKVATTLLFALGGLGAFGLSMTFSRGGMVALIASLCFCGGLVILKSRKEWAAVSIKLFAMLALLFALTHLVGLDQRMAPKEMVTDRSSTARLELWTGGLQMIHLQPLSGWGVGESGKIYMHWFQRLDGTHKVAGMINSYLHVATERGVPFLMGILFPALTLAVVCIRSFLNRDASARSLALALSSLGVWVTFAVANFFSTLWVFEHLWWLPIIAACVILVDITLRKQTAALGVSAILGLAGAFVLSTGLYAVSAIAARSSPVTAIENGCLRIATEGDHNKTYLVYGDASVLGEDFGKRIRELSVLGISILAPFDDTTNHVSEQNYDLVLFCGNQQPPKPYPASLKARTVFMNPLFPPPQKLKSENISVILGALQPISKQMPWHRTAKSRGWQLERIKGSGQDLRSQWPRILRLTDQAHGNL